MEVDDNKEAIAEEDVLQEAIAEEVENVDEAPAEGEGEEEDAEVEAEAVEAE